tara:strand:+ start:1277 stop:1429 length:153 start_codon:yes stop_codon:yes gene_type:complete
MGQNRSGIALAVWQADGRIGMPMVQLNGLYVVILAKRADKCTVLSAIGCM